MNKKMRIYIVRHGETALNALGIMQSRLDESLNQVGRDLAAMTGQGMRGIQFDACVSSPLKRAKETVQILLRESGNNIEIMTDDRIREINLGDFEGRHVSEIGEDGLLFASDPFYFRGFPNGERIQDVITRTQEFLNELISRDDGKTYLVGVHGCAARAMLNFLYEDPSNYWHGHVPYNCAVSIVEAKGGKARLVACDRIYYPKELIVDRYKGQLAVGQNS